MHGFISKKLSLALLLCSYCTALSITLALNYVLAGPRLGPVYDALLGFRAPPPVSGEILLIETDEVIEPSDIFTVFMALSEMGAADLLVEVPLLGTGSGMAETGLEFSYRINDEFNLLGRNIRSLFEGIRLGLVSPVESPAYVDNLVELAERGRERLNAAIIRQDEAGSVRAAQAAAVLGRVITAVDLRSVSPDNIPWYSLPRPDRDGVLRRIAPVTEHGVEHIVYRALKPRWEESTVEGSERGLFLVNRYKSQEDDVERRFSLDRDGNILIEIGKHRSEEGFRRLTLNHFRNYDQTGRVLARLLKEAESSGLFAITTPERIPLILYDYAETLKEELLQAPDAEKRAAWINAREEYVAALDDFLYGPAEMTLVNGYEVLIATEGLDEGGIVRLQGLRDALIRAFVAMRERHRDLIELRATLAQAIDSSFCIMGPTPPAAGMGGVAASGLGTPEASALLANALLTGRCIKPGQSLYIIALSLIASFFVLACIHAFRPLALLTLGLVAGLFCGAAFGLVFILSAYWIDPFIPMAALWGGTLVLAISRFCIGYDRTLRFRLAFAGTVNGKMLKTLVKACRPPLSEIQCAQAVIIAVKNPGMSGREDQETPIEAARIAAEFRQEFSRIFKRQGALVLGIEHDVALACFGSPPQRICRETVTHPVAKALPCIEEMLRNPLSAGWRFGVESGECAFSWSEETGYIANGHPVTRARIFASLALRYHVRVIIGDTARKSSGLTLRKLASLSNESCYELPV
jgi:hypothetical protein